VTRALIRVRREGAVYVLELCAGENLVHHAFLDAMHTALDEVEQSQGPAAFVITGEGKFYSTGFDQAALADPDVAADIVERAVQLCARLLALPVPSCAAINGHAFGIGAMIALCQDFRVMRSDRGFICLPELALGFPLHPGMWALLELRIAPLLLREMMLTGARIGGTRAAHEQLVDAAVDASQVLPEAITRAAQLAPHRGSLLGDYRRNLHARALDVIARGTSFRFPPIPR
jgi:enoyl-CoA hydratase/carnithine racemase